MDDPAHAKVTLAMGRASGGRVGPCERELPEDPSAEKHDFGVQVPVARTHGPASRRTHRPSARRISEVLNRP